VAEIWDERRLVADAFERVHIELDWYDGPRERLVDIAGIAHYFHGHDHTRSSDIDEYARWPAGADALALEREQWETFVDWNHQRTAGAVRPHRHQGIEGLMPGTTN
jgi:hypothetical protein